MQIQEKRRRLITISVPVYNEEDNIASLMTRLKAFSASQPDYDFEFLFTDNASEDATYQRLAEEAKSEPRLRSCGSRVISGTSARSSPTFSSHGGTPPCRSMPTCRTLLK